MSAVTGGDAHVTRPQDERAKAAAPAIPPVAIVHTGVANRASVVAAFERLGVATQLVTTAREVLAAQRVVLPGVGAFAAAMQQLSRADLVEPLRQRILEGRPTLAICLGLQLLGSGSDESGDQPGLGIFAQRVMRLRGPRIPQLGWNQVKADPNSHFLIDGYAYYANSYALDECPDGWAAAWSVYQDRFVAAIERGSVLACQFHPELSGAWGQAIINRWLSSTAEVSSC